MIELSIVLMIVIFMFGAFLKGWSGFGTNLVVPPLLLMLSRFTDSKEVMIIVISVNLVLNIVMLIQNKKFNYHYLFDISVLVLTGITFSVLSSFLFTSIDDSLFRILLGIMIILVTLNRIFKLRFHFKELTNKHYIITGAISGVLNGMFGLGGVPVLILLGSTKMDKEKFKSTLVSYFMVMNFIFILPILFQGGYNGFIFTNILYLVVFAVGACLLGIYSSTRVSDKLFQRVMNFVLIFFGLNLIYSGLFGHHIFVDLF